MNSINSIILEGNLVRDPELKTTSKGTSLCNFSIASNRYFKGQEGNRQDEVSFFDVEVWSKTAENCGKFLEKGRGVRVVGRIKQDRWQDGDGQNRSKIKIVGEHVEFKPKFSGQKEEENSHSKAEKKDPAPVF